MVMVGLAYLTAACACARFVATVWRRWRRRSANYLVVVAVQNVHAELASGEGPDALFNRGLTRLCRGVVRGEHPHKYYIYQDCRQIHIMVTTKISSHFRRQIFLTLVLDCVSLLP